MRSGEFAEALATHLNHGHVNYGTITPVPIAQDGYEVHTADGVFIKQYVFPRAGMIAPQHAHVWDHLTMIARGAMFVWKDGVLDRKYEAPCGIFIAAGVKHTFQTIVDDTIIYCIHSLHGEDKVRILAEHNLTLEDIT